MLQSSFAGESTIESSTREYSLMNLIDLPVDLFTSSSDSIIFPPIENPVKVPSKTFSQVSCAPLEI